MQNLPAEMNERPNSLNPNQNVKDKHHIKTFHVFDRNGSVTTSYRLDVPDSSLREEIIFKHFLSKYIAWFIKGPIAVNLTSRDNPWDFTLDLSNGETLTIEITAIADHEAMFAKMKYEDRMALLFDKNEIQLHELERIHYLFPHPTTNSLIITYKKQGLTKKSRIVNPYYNQRNFIFDSGATDQLGFFKDILKKAIEKKLIKSHLGKDKLILIIDNRTILYNKEEIINSLQSSQDYLDKLPFKEIWIYTGYYSDSDSSNAEYSLIPVRISVEKFEILNQLNS